MSRDVKVGVLVIAECWGHIRQTNQHQSLFEMVYVDFMMVASNIVVALVAVSLVADVVVNV